MPVNIERFRGDTAADEFTITDLAGVIIDITGFTFRLSVDRLEHPPDATTLLYTVVGTITDGPNGVMEFVPTAGNADQRPEVYFYDAELVDGASRTKTFEKGKYTYKQDISK